MVDDLHGPYYEVVENNGWAKLLNKLSDKSEAELASYICCANKYMDPKIPERLLREYPKYACEEFENDLVKQLTGRNSTEKSV